MASSTSSAKDKATGKEQQIRIQASGGLSEDEIQRMVKEAEAHAEDDTAPQGLVEARNQADAAIYATERALNDLGDRLPAETRLRPNRQSLKCGRRQAAKTSIAFVRRPSASARFPEASPKPGPQQPGAAEASQSGEQPGVVDAEFEETNKPEDRKLAKPGP